MTTVRRLQAGSVVMALAFAVTCYQVQGHIDAGRARNPDPVPAPSALEGVGRFARQPVVTYQTTTGESLFALQLQPTLPPLGPKPVDLVIAVDLSASQAGKPFQQSRALADELVKAAAAADRVSLWAVSTPDLTRPLAPLMAPSSPKLRDAVNDLGTVEYPAGAVDLRAGLRKILAALPTPTDRRQAVIYLGDGDSVLAPLGEHDRTALAAEFAARQVNILPVPVGRKLNPNNLHGLASGSGGTVIRWGDADSPVELARKVRAAAVAPVFYPSHVQFNAEVVEALPRRLPPLRADAPTLLVGELKNGKTIAAQIDGSLDGRPHRVELTESVPEPDLANFFLVNVYRQWKSADPAAPAAVRADRSLAMAFEQTRLTRDEVITQAHWALGLGKLDAAEKLFQSARQIDPADSEAAAGLKVIDKVRQGQIDRASLIGSDRDQVARLASDDDAESIPAARAVDGPTARADLLEQEKQRRKIQEQQNRQLVDDVIRKARQSVTVNPDAAYDTLKRQLESVQNNIDLSDSVRNELAARIEGALRTIAEEGRRVTQRQDAELARRLADEARRSALAARQSDEERVRERIRTFSMLMNQARYEEAYKEALVLQQERIAQGRSIPPQAIAAYNMSLNAANLREFEELRRVKEDRYMLTMLQVDRAHIPFPDEPPVAFPPAAVWKTITELRRGRYESDGLGQTTRKTIELREKLNQSIDIFKEGLDGVPLREVLTSIQDRLGVTIIIDGEAFRADRNLQDVGEQPVRLPKMPGVTLGTVLRFLLAPFGGTYIVRRDFIEITTFDRSIIDKAVRAYPVADLVIPIPNAVDVGSLNQNLQVLGGQLSANGQAIFGTPQAFQGGALGFAGPLGALGALGATGSLGGLGGGLGAPGVGGAGFQAQGGIVGFAGGTQATNLGFGGGALGFGGGQQGQFGNLGGQFGIQGGDTSGILIQLIQDTIAPKEWNTTAAAYIFQNTLTQGDDEAPALSPDKLNSLGYYQPSRALVVRGSSRIHTRISTNIGPGGLGGGAKANKDGDVFVQGGSKDRPWKRATDPKTTWHQQMALGHFKPRQVIAVADLLAHAEKFEDVAELLKADLRHGVLAHECVHEALAVALKSAGASPEEVERVRLSRVDLAPTDSEAFLKAAQDLAEMGRTDLAREFCRRAAQLNPNEPDAYAKALAFAGRDGDRDLDTARWAADNLLKREWGTDEQRLHHSAKQTMAQLAQAMEAQGRTDDAERVRATLDESRRRDLIIEAMWGDHADIDLTVREPIGTTCSSIERLTPAGGRWIGDKFDANRESYIAAEAFPGSYLVEVRRIWGKPLSGKVNVKVTKNHGTPGQAIELHTLQLDPQGRAEVTIHVENGRRTRTMAVPSKVAMEGNPVPRAKSPDQVFGMLRSMADPVYGGLGGGEGFNGGVTAGSPYADPMAARAAFALESGTELSLQTTIAPAVSSGVDLTTRTVISGDRKSMTVSFKPIFDADKMTAPQVKLSFIPGSGL